MFDTCAYNLHDTGAYIMYRCAHSHTHTIQHTQERQTHATWPAVAFIAAFIAGPFGAMLHLEDVYNEDVHNE